VFTHSLLGDVIIVACKSVEVSEMGVEPTVRWREFPFVVTEVPFANYPRRVPQVLQVLGRTLPGGRARGSAALIGQPCIPVKKKSGVPKLQKHFRKNCITNVDMCYGLGDQDSNPSSILPIFDGYLPVRSADLAGVQMGCE
jgi:hypothetical protein